ncbi:hypothetical protein RCK22_22675, partial [Salmonella enterica subsp. enterica serovar Stanley]
QGEATPLAVVQQIDKLYVNFTQSAGEVMRLRAALASGQLQRAAGKEAPRCRWCWRTAASTPRRAGCCSAT